MNKQIFDINKLPSREQTEKSLPKKITIKLRENRAKNIHSIGDSNWETDVDFLPEQEIVLKQGDCIMLMQTHWNKGAYLGYWGVYEANKPKMVLEVPGGGVDRSIFDDFEVKEEDKDILTSWGGAWGAFMIVSYSKEAVLDRLSYGPFNLKRKMKPGSKQIQALEHIYTHGPVQRKELRHIFKPNKIGTPTGEAEFFNKFSGHGYGPMHHQPAIWSIKRGWWTITTYGEQILKNSGVI